MFIIFCHHQSKSSVILERYLELKKKHHMNDLWITRNEKYNHKIFLNNIIQNELNENSRGFSMRPKFFTPSNFTFCLKYVRIFYFLHQFRQIMTSSSLLLFSEFYHHITSHYFYIILLLPFKNWTKVVINDDIIEINIHEIGVFHVGAPALLIMLLLFFFCSLHTFIILLL